MFNNFRKVYREYPSKFWILISVYFIDRLGGALIFPFLALYITTKFNVGMTEVGFIMAIYSGSAFIGNLLGGALTDKFGRKSILIIGLVSSASVSLMMGLVNTWEVFYLLALITGFVSMIGGPAASAMLADLLPIEKRADGFGILRVAVNLSVTFGPAIGGLLAGISYQLLFVMDFLVSIIAAGIVFKALSETKPETADDQPESGILQSISGYKEVFKDRLFVIFIFLTMITAIIYLQITTEPNPARIIIIQNNTGSHWANRRGGSTTEHESCQITTTHFLRSNVYNQGLDYRRNNHFPYRENDYSQQEVFIRADITIHGHTGSVK